MKRRKHRQVLPGFGLSLGYAIFYLSLVIVIPLSTIFVKSASLPLAGFVRLLAEPQVASAFRVSFGISLLAALTNVVIGLVLSWVLVRYPFPGRRLLDAAVDLPFALPTAVAGISLAALYGPRGWLGKVLIPHGITVDFTLLGVYVALVFIGLPFVVRTVQPVLEDVDAQIEEAAASLGASRTQTIARVLLPGLMPAILTGFALAFARALGEYGSVQFISSNIPLKSQIVPNLLYEMIGQFDLRDAAAIAVVMLLCSFVVFFAINVLQRWTARYR